MVLKKGCNGEDVKKLQMILSISPADGVFGPKTEEAVKQFQKDNGLYADGIVGSKTMNVIMSVNMDTDSSDKEKSNDLIIEEHFLPKGEYLEGKYKNEYVVLHHTAGWDNPYQVIDSWGQDDRGRVATEFVIGGQRCTDGRNVYDGKILKSFPDGCQGGHIGKSGSVYMNMHSVGIEMCNFGMITNGKTYVGSNVIEEQIANLNEPFHGSKQWHRYSDEQLKSAHDLLMFISERDNIDLHNGIYKWIKSEGAKAFDFHSDAYYGKVKGFITHANIRKDKNDCFPQQELIDMILTL